MHNAIFFNKIADNGSSYDLQAVQKEQKGWLVQHFIGEK